jgi:STE24 endopeptidase
LVIDDDPEFQGAWVAGTKTSNDRGRMSISPGFWVAVVLVSVLLPWLIETVVALLNLRRLDNRPRLMPQDLYDAGEYLRSQDYTRDRTRVELVESATRLAALLAFWGCGGFPWIERVVGGLSSRPLVAGLAGFSAVYLASLMMSLPFSLYRTFVVEARHGFNRTSPMTYFTDVGRSVAVAAVIGLPVATAVLWFFGNVPQAWLWAWGVTTAVAMGTSFLGPRLVLPLFYKFSPLEAGPLREAIGRLADRCQFPFAEIEVVDGSRRSTKANAFFAGFGRTKRIALYDTLVEKFSGPEIEAVLAHEIGHFKRRHVIRTITLVTLLTGGYFLLLDGSLGASAFHAAFGFEDPSLWLRIVLFALGMRLPNLVASVLLCAASRRHEFEADAFASGAMHSAAPLVAALRKLARDHLAQLWPHPWLVALTYSHPPITQRLEALAGAPVGLKNSEHEADWSTRQ